MSSANDLTILLTLKDRVAFTVRWMNYANSITLPFKVLIADGGSDDRVSAMLAEKTRFSNVDYEYVRYPCDKSYADYYTKVANALAKIQTQFVVMADNDDFFVVDTLNEAVKFLSVNPDYSSCGGQAGIFWIRRSLLDKREDPLYGKNVDWKCAQADSITADTASERLRSHSMSSCDPYYDVKRIENARKQFEIVRDLNLKDLGLVEILVQFLMAIAGKTKRLERMHIARQFGSPGSSGRAHYEAYGDWFARMLLESWSDDFTKVVKTASGCLAAADGMSIDEAKDCVISSYRMVAAPWLLSDVLNEHSVSMQMTIVAAIGKRIVGLPEDSIMKKFMRFLYRKIHRIALNAGFGMELFTTPAMNSRRDFTPIREFLAHPLLFE